MTRKTLLFFVFCSFCVASQAQKNARVKSLTVTRDLKLGQKVTDISTDGTFTDADDETLPTQQAVKEYVDSRPGLNSDTLALNGDTLFLNPNGGSVLLPTSNNSVSNKLFVDGSAKDTTRIQINGSLLEINNGLDSFGIVGTRIPPSTPFDAIVCLSDGQSNLGRAPNSSLPDSLAGEQNNAFVFTRLDGKTPKANPDNDLPNSGQSGQHGVWPYAIAKLQKKYPGVPIFIAQYGIGGTPQSVYTYDGNDLLINGYFIPLIKTLRNRGYRNIFAFNYHCQIEGNTGDGEDEYFAKKDSMINKRSSQIGRIPTMLLTAAGPGDAPEFRRDSLHRALFRLAKKHPHVSVIDARGLSTIDGTHFDGAAFDSIATRMIEILQYQNQWGKVDRDFSIVPDYSFEGYHPGDTVIREFDGWNAKAAVVDTFDSNRMEIVESGLKSYDLEALTLRIANIGYCTPTLNHDTLEFEYDLLLTGNRTHGVFFNLTPHADFGNIDRRPVGITVEFSDSMVYAYRMLQGNMRFGLLNSASLILPYDKEVNIKFRRERFQRIYVYVNDIEIMWFGQVDNSSGSVGMWVDKTGTDRVFFDNISLSYNRYHGATKTGDLAIFDHIERLSKEVDLLGVFDTIIDSSFKIQIPQTSGVSSVFEITDPSRDAHPEIFKIWRDGSDVYGRFNARPGNTHFQIAQSNIVAVTFSNLVDGQPGATIRNNKDWVLAHGGTAGRAFRPAISGSWNLGNANRYWGTLYAESSMIKGESMWGTALSNQIGEINFSNSSDKFLVRGTLNHSLSLGANGFDDYLLINTNGSIRLEAYGLGGNTGTPTKVLAVDASGNLIEENITGNLYSTNGTLVEDREITRNGNNFVLLGGNTGGYFSFGETKGVAGFADGTNTGYLEADATHTSLIKAGSFGTAKLEVSDTSILFVGETVFPQKNTILLSGGRTDNLDVRGLNRVRLNASSAQSLSGLLALKDGTEIILQNISTHTITLEFNEFSSNLNRFKGLPGFVDFDMPGGSCYRVLYDSDLGGFQIISN